MDNKKDVNYKYLRNKLKGSKNKDKLNDISKSSEKRIESEHKHSKKKNKTEMILI